MVQRLPRFARDAAELGSLLERAMLTSCHHCGAHGTLIGHGLLRGYAEHSSDKVVRGRRFFCTNRGNRNGCGRTVSVLLATWVRGFCVGVAALWSLFCGLSDGVSVARATSLYWPLSMRSAYRLARRLRLGSLTWRAWLCARSQVPNLEVHNPLAQLEQHLTRELGPTPFSMLQLRSNASLL